MKRSAAFSLLEVILAMAILAGAIAVLGEAARNALRNAQAARDLARAQLLCESKMAEITAGITAPETAQGAPLDTSGDPNESGWLCSIDVEGLEVDGLLSVRVTVARDLPPEQRPVQYSLVRWLANATAAAATSQSSDSDGQNSSSSTSGTGDGSSTSGTGGAKP